MNDKVSKEDWPDTREIKDLKLGYELQPTLGEIIKQHPWPDSAFEYHPPKDAPEGFVVTDEIKAEALARWKDNMRDIPTEEGKAAWEKAHAEDLARIRVLLGKCEVNTADDIKVLGCTGATSFGLTIENIKFLRMGLAGSGVGLPCFVPPTLFCLAHNTIGGRQKGQLLSDPNLIIPISRDLTSDEITGSKIVSKALLARGNMEDAFQVLQDGEDGKKSLLENIEALRKEGGIDDIVAAGRMQPVAWKCPEHAQIVWTCRYCVAQAVVEGELLPVLEVKGAVNTDDSSVEGIIENANKQNVDNASVWARIATFSRKLSKD